MEKIVLTLLIFLIPSFWYLACSQDFQGARTNTSDTTYEWFLMGVIPPSAAPVYVKSQKTKYIWFKQADVQWLKFDSTRNDGILPRALGVDNRGHMKVGTVGVTGTVSAAAIAAALGFTPYSAANPNNYISASSISTLTNKSGNISQWTNDANYTANTYSAGFGLLKTGTDPNAAFAVNTASIVTTQRMFDTLALQNTRIGSKVEKSTVLNINGIAQDLSTSRIFTLTTTTVGESTNLYYTNARARSALSAGSGLSYNSSTGQFSNTAQDQTVILSGLGSTTITGTYPNFTVNSSSADLSNYYTKSQSDSRYLQSYTETDPLWTTSPSFSITGTNISNWNTAFGWGNHASMGYLTSGSTSTLTNKSGNISQWTNDLGYLTSFTEIDPTVPSYVKSINNSDITNWNGKFDSPTGSSAQYLRGDGSYATFPSIPATQINSDWSSNSGVSEIFNKPTTLSGYGITDAYPLSGNPSGFISSYSPTLTSAGYSIGVTGGNTITLPTPTLSSAQVTTGLGYIPLQIEVDGSIANEIQSLSISGQSLSISGSNTIVIPTQTTALTSAQVTTALGFVPATNTVVSDKTIAISSTNTVLLNVTSSYPNFTLSPYSQTTFTASRPINSATFQPSSTKMAWVYYTIRINCIATIGSASSGTVALQYSMDSGSTWVDVGQVENSNIVTLAVTLNSNTTQTGQVGGVIPIGAIVKMNQSSSGTTTITFVRGQETY